MRKIYLTVLTGFVSFGAFAQLNAVQLNTNFQATPKMKALNPANVVSNPTPAQNAARAVIWSEDFGSATTGGIPTGWVASGAQPIWKKAFHGSNGPFGTASLSLASVSANNGVLLFDADSLNFALHPSTPPSGAGYTQMTGTVTSPNIDLTGHSNVILQFQQLFRLCCSPATSLLTVSVSGNGGASWTDYDVKGNTAINAATANPSSISINISGVAGNSATTQVKFTYDAETYFWQIDDIAIVDGDDNDLVLETVYPDFYFKNGGFYGQFPISQATPMAFRGAIYNNGGVAQNNVKMNMTVTPTGGTAYTQTSNVLTSFAPLLRDTLLVDFPIGFTATTLGTHTIDFALVQDEVDAAPATNSASRTFNVTQTIYGRDNNLTSGATNVRTISTTDYVGGDADGSMIANQYDFPNVTTINGASVFIAPSTSIGTSFDFVLYSIDATGNFVEETTSQIYDIDATNKRNKWVTLPFLAGDFTTTVDAQYFIAVRMSGQNATGTQIDLLSDLKLENIQPEQTTLVNFNAGDPAQWGTIGASSPLIRLVVDDATGIENVATEGINLLQNTPNPTNGVTKINYAIANKANVSLSIYDIAGKLISTNNQGVRVAGNHSIMLDTKNMESGVYFYTLTVGDNARTAKMSVIK